VKDTWRTHRLFLATFLLLIVVPQAVLIIRKDDIKAHFARETFEKCLEEPCFIANSLWQNEGNDVLTYYHVFFTFVVVQLDIFPVAGNLVVETQGIYAPKNDIECMEQDCPFVQTEQDKYAIVEVGNTPQGFGRCWAKLNADKIDVISRMHCELTEPQAIK